jgi:hypothetical protein
MKSLRPRPAYAHPDRRRGFALAREAHLADVLSIVLDYVYAGEEREAWEFYEATYGLPDKAQLKREVKRSLRAEPVYRFVYGKRAAG